MAKLPAFQFYPGDWLKDPNLRSVSIAARGLWVDMLCLMFESESRGSLTIGGRPASDVEIARMTGIDQDEARRLLGELREANVFSETEQGCIYSRRLVRDDQIRAIRKKCGKLGAEYGVMGGRPKKQETPKTAKKPLPEPQTEGQNNPPSVSSSPTREREREREFRGRDIPPTDPPEEITGDDPVSPIPDGSENAICGPESDSECPPAPEQPAENQNASAWQESKNNDPGELVVPLLLSEQANAVFGLTGDAILRDWIARRNWPPDWIAQAMAITASREEIAGRGSRSVRYTESILQDWTKNGGPENGCTESRRTGQKTRVGAGCPAKIGQHLERGADLLR